jgi:hypothetical protein
MVQEAIGSFDVLPGLYARAIRMASLEGDDHAMVRLAWVHANACAGVDVPGVTGAERELLDRYCVNMELWRFDLVVRVRAV